MNHRWNVTALCLLLAGVTVGAGQTTQSPQPQRPMFRTQVEYVEVDVLVSNTEGHFVSDLKKEDFIIREDGKAQTIRTFSMVNVPIEHEDIPIFVDRPILPDVASNQHAFDGRIYVLIMDDLHVDPTRSQKAKNAARKFIQENLASNDLMAVMTVGGSEAVTQEFTSNKELLLAAVDNFIGTKLESSTIARNNEYFMQLAVENRATLLRDTTISDPFEMTRLFNARATLRTIRDVADWFGGVRGRRKSVLLVSEGLDYQVNQVLTLGSSGTSSQIQSDNQGGAQMITDLLEAIGAAQRANVSLYTVDPRGLTALADESITQSGFAAQNEQNVPQGTAQNFMARTIGPATMRDELMRSQDDLRTLAEETGGTAAVNMNNFDTAFDRIVRDGSAYYVLAYYPPSEKRDGKFHRIDVDVKRPGVTVRARNGYRSPRGAAPEPELPSGTRTMSPELRDGLSSPLPIAGLTMHVFAAPFRGTGEKASVLLGIDAVGSNLNLTDKNTLELGYMALDSKRQLHAGSSDRLSLNILRPETRARAQQTGFRVLNRLDLEPGRYQLRVASHDSMGGAAGTIIWDLEVPDFNSEPMTMSGIVMTSVTASGWTNGKADELMRKVLPAQPTALRAFPQQDEIALFAEIYDNRVTTPHQVEIVSTVVTSEGRVLFKSQEERSSIEIAGGTTGAFGYTARIPLKDIAPGTYVLNVRARSSLNGGGQAERQLQFRVQGGQTGQASPAGQAGQAGVRTIEKGQMSVADTMRQLTVRSESEWAAFWHQHAPNRPEPAVDFQREMIVGIFLGTRPTGGHSVEITGTRSDQDALVVQYREQRPDKGAITTQMITSPYHLVAVPVRTGTVRFEKAGA